MDSEDEEMVAALLEEETKDATASVDDSEHMEILTGLLTMHAKDSNPLRGGSKLGWHKQAEAKAEGYCMLYADYFADDPLHGEVVFQCLFRMNWNFS
jgi:hypothetical protein